ncbi:MAG: hypothetical protein PWP76_453 [Candidatus Diapherotrites archaeon]|nr:hypothetical protein [Candidatus Diapherotrites archaeon]
MRGQVVKNPTYQIVIHAVAITLLLLAALTLATKFGMIHCSQVPYWCSGYRAIISAIYGRTYPAVIILHGDEGMGDPRLLSRLLEDKCRIYADVEDVDTVSPGNLDRYDVVIIERARKLSPEQMDMLWDFTAKGGRILIIGDVGVEPESPAEYVQVEEFNEETNTTTKRVVNTWDRQDEFGNYVLFGTRFLGLKYHGNYCEDEDCEISGTISFKPDVLTAGLPNSAPFPLNFAVVEDLRSSVLGPHTVVATIDNVAPVYGQKAPYPAIIRTGYRMIYMAFPPEDLWELVDRETRSGTVPPYASVALIVLNICNWASS